MLFALAALTFAPGPAAAAPLRFGALSASSTSANWAGYVVSAPGSSFSDIKGTWVEPTATCTNATAASAFWIGLGGATQSSAGLEQIGSSADCQFGRPSYYAWLEILPAPSVNLPVRIAPGDTIAAEVAASGTTFTFTLTDVTTGATYTTTETVSNPAVDTAEWIAEAPSLCMRKCQILPLANFGSVGFSAASATANTHTGTISDASWTSDAVQLGTRSVVQAVPSSLSADGTSFNVAWQSAGASTTLTPPRTRPRNPWSRPRPHR
jgi:hypothetical protein